MKIYLRSMHMKLFCIGLQLFWAKFKTVYNNFSKYGQSNNDCFSTDMDGNYSILYFELCGFPALPVVTSILSGFYILNDGVLSENFL